MSGQFAHFDPDDLERSVGELVNGQPTFVPVTTPSTAGLEFKIRHGLGRVPKGYAIAKRPYTDFYHGHDTSDTPWTSEHMYLKFSVASLALTLAIF